MLKPRSIDRVRRVSGVVFLLLAAQTLTSAVPAYANSIWYVAASFGSDANACNASNLPCKTINGAIAKAQPGDEIRVTADIYTGSGSAEIVRVDKGLLILGGWDLSFNQHAGFTILNGEHQRRGLVVEQGADVQLSDVAIIWGFGSEGGGAYVAGGLVGARLFIVQNRALQGGGIFFNGGVGDWVQLFDSAVYANEYFAQGGGLFIDGFRILDPAAHTASGGFLGNVTVSNNVSINSVDEEHGTPPTQGGGVYVHGGLLSTQHATFAENTVFDGRSFTQNSAGIAVSQNTAAGSVVLANALIADGCLAKIGQILSAGINVERGNTCNLTVLGDKHNVNPLIYPPNRNPGPNDTITHAIAWNSPAINWAKPEWCRPHDQRGVKRPQGLLCDVGAYERAATDAAMGLITHPGMGFADADRCPTLSWDANGRPRHNPCRVSAEELIEAILGSVGNTHRGGDGEGDLDDLGRRRGRHPLPGGR